MLAAVYDSSEATLELAFRTGANYRYSGIPAEIYQQLSLAESKGRYFNNHIRNRFACLRIPALSIRSLMFHR